MFAAIQQINEGIERLSEKDLRGGDWQLASLVLRFYSHHYVVSGTWHLSLASV